MESEGRSPLRIFRHAPMISEVFTAVPRSLHGEIKPCAAIQKGGFSHSLHLDFTFAVLATWFACGWSTGGDGSIAFRLWRYNRWAVRFRGICQGNGGLRR